MATEEEVNLFRRYKYRLRPTKNQEFLLIEMLEDHRTLYNAALEERRLAWKMNIRHINRNMQKLQLKDIRAFDTDFQRWSFQTEADVVERVHKSFEGFFRRVKNNEIPGFPRYKGYGRYNSVTYPVPNNGYKCDSKPNLKSYYIRLQGIGHVRCHMHRRFEGNLKNLTIKRENNQWYAIFACGNIKPKPLPKTGSVVGFDLGLVTYLTTSDGLKFENPRYFKKVDNKVRDIERSLSRCERHSNRRKQIKDRLAKQHRKIRLQRRDHAHKLALNLIQNNDIICHEKLLISNMVRRPIPKYNQSGNPLSNGASNKAGLNKSIKDAAWGQFLLIIHEKAESAVREVIAVNPKNTSRKCPECNYIDAANRPKQAVFKCVKCNHSGHADEIAALNILRAGLAHRNQFSDRERKVVCAVKHKHGVTRSRDSQLIMIGGEK